MTLEIWGKLFSIIAVQQQFLQGRKKKKQCTFLCPPKPPKRQCEKPHFLLPGMRFLSDLISSLTFKKILFMKYLTHLPVNLYHRTQFQTSYCFYVSKYTFTIRKTNPSPLSSVSRVGCQFFNGLLKHRATCQKHSLSCPATICPFPLLLCQYQMSLCCTSSWGTELLVLLEHQQMFHHQCTR